MGLQNPVSSDQPMASHRPQYDARDLIKNGDMVNIVLDDQVYVLRITRAGKLILTK